MKLIIYGFSAIITLIVVLALLGTVNSFLKALISDLSVGVPTKSTFCTYDSDCIQNPSNCSECVNRYSIAIGLMQPCQSDLRTCICEGNKCRVAE